MQLRDILLIKKMKNRINLKTNLNFMVMKNL